jgi:hypothetical protein
MPRCASTVPGGRVLLCAPGRGARRGREGERIGGYTARRRHGAVGPGDNRVVADSPEALIGGLSLTGRRLLTKALSYRLRLVVRGLVCPCPTCALEGTAVALIHVEQSGCAIYRSDVVAAEGGVMLAFAKELLEQARHPAAVTIKHRRRDDNGDRHQSSGCVSCDAMFDPHQLADLVEEVHDQGDLGTLQVLGRASRIIAEWAILFDAAGRPSMEPHIEHCFAGFADRPSPTWLMPDCTAWVRGRGLSGPPVRPGR